MLLQVEGPVTARALQGDSFSLRILAAALLMSTACAAEARDWQFAVTPYLWLPNIEGRGTTQRPPGGGEPAFEIGPVDYLEHLDFVLMLAGEARRDRWSLRSDIVYVDFSNQRSAVRSVSGPGGVVEVPVNAGTRSSFTGLEAQATFGYRLLDQPQRCVEVFGGLRYLDVDFSLDWRLDGPISLLPQSGHVEQGFHPLDAIVGMHARFALGDGSWFVPVQADIGTGSSSLTWRLAAGVGYAFSWGDLQVAYRHLGYEDDQGELLEQLTLSGPAVGASFRF